MRADDRRHVRSRLSVVGHRQQLLLALSLVIGSVLLMMSASQAYALTLGVGWSGEPGYDIPEMPLVASSGATTFRVPGGFIEDGLVEAAAKNHVTILAQLGGSDALPPTQERGTFLQQVTGLVQRYGVNGSFWSQHPGLPAEPITTWEVWNEPNAAGIPPAEYGLFLDEVAETIHNSSLGGSPEILSGGLLVWGNSGQGETGVLTYQGALRYLEEAYLYFGGNSYVTGVAIHPYELETQTFQNKNSSRFEAFEYAVSGFHQTLVELANRNGWQQKSLSITETGWPVHSQPFEIKGELKYLGVSEAEQASLLGLVIAYARVNEGNLNLRHLDWYNFRDSPRQQRWDDFCGLRDSDGHFRAAWTEFQLHAGVAPGIPAPTVETGAATQVREFQATLDGTVDAMGSATSYHFDYGLTTSYGSKAPIPDGSAGSTGAVSRSAVVSGLQPGTTYHYRLVASNAHGTAYGADQHFTTTSAPAAVNTGSAINVYSRAENGGLYQKSCCSGAEGWSNWWYMGSPLEQGLSSGPAAAMYNDTVNVYATAATGRLNQKTCCSAPAGWSEWWDMGEAPGGRVTSSPAAIMYGSNFNVYVRGGDGHLYQKDCCSNSGGWSSWFDMGAPPGGEITSSPAVVDAGGGVINVYARGINGHIYQKNCCSAPAGWSEWWDMGEPPSGGIASSPAAVNTGSAVNLYVTGGDGHLYQKSCCSVEGWSSWWDMGHPAAGPIVSGPATVKTNGGVINVYARSTDGHIYQKDCCSGSEGWSAWWDMGDP